MTTKRLIEHLKSEIRIHQESIDDCESEIRLLQLQCDHENTKVEPCEFRYFNIVTCLDCGYWHYEPKESI